jgi:membrane dipeptidase
VGRRCGKMARMNQISRFALAALLGATGSVVVSSQTASSGVSPQAAQVHSRAIVLDTHADTTQRMIFDPRFNIGERHSDGNIDIPRMRDGGMDALFFSIWVPSEVTGPIAVKRAFDQIDAVREAVRTHPNDLMLATTAAEVRKAAADHKIAALMGMEGGHMIDDDLRLLRDYYALGVRYMTLTHFKNNNWADSSTDRPAHNGLTAFGKDVVREMNRLGMMIDISHVADKTFYDVIALTKVPVIASHSSSRAIANHPRNMTDDMMRALAKNGGVIMINYHAGFLSEEFRVASEKRSGDIVNQMAEMSKKCGGNEACTTMEDDRMDHEAMMNGQLPKVSWEKIIEHIDHAVKVAGADHVGLGSDFDGATMPLGMEDVTKLPKITDALLKKGYSEQDVEKILGANLLRAMEAVENGAGK